MKESEEMRLKSTINESTLSTAARSPFPNEEGLRYEDAAFLALSERIQDMWGKQYRWTKPSLRGEGGERSEPDRGLAG